MAQQLVYPTSQRLRMIEQELLPVLTANDPIFQLFPIEEEDDDLLRWEQKDNYKGLQQIRGLNNLPPRISRIGGRGFVATPGYYGEFGTIDEREITKRRKWGTFGDAIDISDPVLEIQEQLLMRRLNRLRQICWMLATTGTFAVSNAQGVLMLSGAYTMQTYTSLVPWSTYATATPLADLRFTKLLARGHSIVYDNQSLAFANAVTVNDLVMNSNVNDLYGRRGVIGSTLNSLVDINGIFLANDLPRIIPYDEGYLDENGVFQLFIPNGIVILIGRRENGAALGAYRMTRNANNPGAAPGPYTRVIDNIDTTREIPRQINVHDGHNGGPVLYYPSAIVRMNVGG